MTMPTNNAELIDHLLQKHEEQRAARVKGMITLIGAAVESTT